MIESDYLFLREGPSTLPLPGGAAGRGVFAKFDIPAEQVICEYRGLVLDSKFGALLPPPAHSKSFSTTTPDGRMWTILGDSICSRINDAANVVASSNASEALYTAEQLDAFEQRPFIDSIPTYPGYRYNARSLPSAAGKIFIVSLEHIPAGSEIFYAYGK